MQVCCLAAQRLQRVSNTAVVDCLQYGLPCSTPEVAHLSSGLSEHSQYPSAAVPADAFRHFLHASHMTQSIPVSACHSGEAASCAGCVSCAGCGVPPPAADAGAVSGASAVAPDGGSIDPPKAAAAGSNPSSAASGCSGRHGNGEPCCGSRVSPLASGASSCSVAICAHV